VFLKNHRFRRSAVILKGYFLILSVILAACGGPQALPGPPSTSSQIPAQTPQVIHSETATAGIPTVTPTPQAIRNRIILYAHPETDPGTVNLVKTYLTNTVGQVGLDLEVTASFETPGPETKLVIALTSEEDVSEIAKNSPEVQFIVIGNTPINSDNNLSVLQTTATDQQGFLAGYTAAVITSDWRVGILSVSDSPIDRSARDGFISGAIYFCGLCRQTYPPYYDSQNIYIKYPLSREVPAGSSEADWQAAADYLIERSVKTIYLAPEASSDALHQYFAEAGIVVLGSYSPSGFTSDRWAATFRQDLVPPLDDVLPSIFAGEGGFEMVVGLEIADVNPELLSQGRLRLVENILVELQGGYIDTGVSK
jgi:hypothetical protein